MTIPRKAAMSVMTGLLMVSCKDRLEPASPLPMPEVQGTNRDFQYAGFIVRHGDVPQAKMLRLVAAELRGGRGARTQDLQQVDELIALCDKSEQDSAAKADAIKRWEVLRPKIDLALMMAPLRAYDDPANDADAQCKELKTETNR